MMQTSRSMNVACGLLLVIILFTVGCSSAVALEPGATAPNFSLSAVRGGSFQLADHAGQVILLSFINTRAEASSATADPSRAQIVFLKSMQEQYGSKGLVVLIVDAAHIATGKRASQDELINFTYDWQLEDIPVLDDADSSAARSYGVKSTPATFLIGANRIVQQRWDGFAAASQLALSIEVLVGAPSHRQTDAAESPMAPLASACPDETPPQAKFSGVGLARPLSQDLWVVDGGGRWGTGAAFPVQWILIDVQNLTRRTVIQMRVLGEYIDTQQTVVLSDGSMELLAIDVASGLLSGDATPPKVYSLASTLLLERSGCLRIGAVITEEGATSPLYQGNLVISIQ